MSDDLTCRELVELVTDYLEDALPADERRRVEAHLPACPYCTEYVEQMRTIARELPGLAADTIGAGTRAALLAAFRTRGEPL